MNQSIQQSQAKKSLAPVILIGISIIMGILIILSIFVAISIPIYNSARDSARLAACKNNLRTMDGAIERWRADDPVNHTYNAAISKGLSGLKAEGYLKVIPTCPDRGTYSLTRQNGVAFTNCNKPGHSYRLQVRPTSKTQ